MFSNQTILRIAMEQSARDLGCTPEDFTKPENVIVDGTIGPDARVYYTEPVPCNLVSYGSNIVASVKPAYREIVAEYLGKFEFFHCFETPNMHWLNDRLTPLGQKVCFMAEYFLPDVEKLVSLPCPYELRLLGPDDFIPLYTPEWSNALCAARRHLDVLGVGAYDGDRLIGLAGCSADCADMWQIGIDVLPAYRRQGVASVLTSRLAMECLAREKVPFYCCAWSNIRSARNAIRAGFRPAWVEMTAKPAEMVDKMNG